MQVVPPKSIGARRALVLLLPLLLGACATVGAPDVPVQLQPAAAEALVLVAAAKGVQIYECRAGSPLGRFEWTFVAPEAALLDAQGRHIGDHGAGPSWRLADGSSVVGKVRARTDAPVPGAIPWLLLDGSGRGTKGLLAGVTSIQRVNTRSGSAPENGCDTAAIGRVARVPYSADYYFYARRDVPLNFY